MDYNEIKNLAIQNKISIRQLSDRIGMSEQGLHAAIKNNTLKVRDLEKIAGVLGVPLNYFFVENNNIKIKGQMHNGSGDIISSDNRDLIMENELLKKEVEGLKREIELLKEMIEMLKKR